MYVVECVKGSETTRRFADLLEGATELRKVIMLKGMVHCRERIQISKGKSDIRRSPGESGPQLPSPSGVIGTMLNSLSNNM